jgi:uncharacterized repeat protein (TIGR03803 family)
MSYKDLHFFNLTNGIFPNGVYPSSLLVSDGNTLYGTTYGVEQFNNPYDLPISSGSYGTIYSIPKSGGQLTTIHAFNGVDGYLVNQQVILDGNTLYGTTVFGGLNGYGIIFSIPKTGGALTTLFSGTQFRASPNVGFILNGKLYGTVTYSGTNGPLVFSLNISNNILTYLTPQLQATGPWGDIPCRVINTDGTLIYGMTEIGHQNRDLSGYGTIFSTPISGGPVNFLLFFDQSTVGRDPIKGFYLNGNTLYGTVSNGLGGPSTIFSIPKSGGSPTILYTTSLYIYSTFISDGTNIYGTSTESVFYFPISGGPLKTIYTFNCITGGCGSSADLLLDGTTLYGTNPFGPRAEYNPGYGTVFSLNLKAAFQDKTISVQVNINTYKDPVVLTPLVNNPVNLNLTFSSSTNLPYFLSLNQTTGEIMLLTNNICPGVYKFLLTVTSYIQGVAGMDTQDINLEFIKPPPDPPNLWSRATLSCVGYDQEQLNMRRKAEVLKYKGNQNPLTKKQQWSRIVNGNGPLAKKVWATQNDLGSNPNVFNLEQVGNTLIECPTVTLLYAATGGGGLSISFDGGNTFTTRTTANGLGSNGVLGVYAFGSTVYAATSGGLSISLDSGNSFTNKTIANGLLSDYVYGVYAVGSTVYAATQGGLSISLDSGNSFITKTPTNSGLGNIFVYGVYAIGSTIYAATAGGGLSISTNSGSSFTTKTYSNTSGGLGSNGVFGVYAVGSTVYAATQGGLSISLDSGNTFTNKTTTNGLGNNLVYGVYAIGSTIYAATGGGGLSISLDSGSSFSNKTYSNTSGGLGSDIVFGVYAVGSTIYAATAGGGLSISTDSGNSFINKTTADGLGNNFVNGVYAVQPKKIICESSSASDVPGNSVLCYDPSVPLVNYLPPQRTFLAGGTKWPQYSWQPGDNGFPRGKKGMRMLFQ